MLLAFRCYVIQANNFYFFDVSEINMRQCDKIVIISDKQHFSSLITKLFT